jgi:hypothetical protein
VVVNPPTSWWSEVAFPVPELLHVTDPQVTKRGMPHYYPSEPSPQHHNPRQHLKESYRYLKDQGGMYDISNPSSTNLKELSDYLKELNCRE